MWFCVRCLLSLWMDGYLPVYAGVFGTAFANTAADQSFQTLRSLGEKPYDTKLLFLLSGLLWL